MLDLPIDLPEFLPGSVWLAGAGPGDPGLLTLLALHAIKSAEVVIHDALVDGRILALIPAAAEIESMGKRGGEASVRQAEITARMIHLAKAGKRVLRLKGGDPFVFGRGPEEALALAGAGVPFRIVPGITAGIGGLAYAGIPVTAKETNSAVAFVTGHGPDGEMPDAFDWDALARGAPVLVFYMGLKHLERLTSRLMAAGRRPDEAAALVCNAATERQSVLETTLAEAAGAVERAGLKPPALFVVGQVVALRRQLDWWRG
ncbi:Uroporphyrinogen-III methyltransferase [Paramagnetospirillum magnetotacticum MS-1]|uniref:uroporphyrinogen-III C-methyltransferase n=1 Tax=Paramagnetospirillum magnetotacticum MS-1 TaxID=272627 RepID=A0A0C2V3K6_PARME|nr:uroporphyrinogen-III C-methyltransferase [Paramagnetospirillum magnetotacticum]KIL99641.1 Uroporphyrinogen-III methyltransferase [Paramagnetospirillum magnetotacticum MS-1]